MQVTIKLFASFRTGRFDVENRDYPAGTTVADVAASLNIPKTDVGIIMVNNRHVKLEHVLLEHDAVALFPVLGGG